MHIIKKLSTINSTWVTVQEVDNMIVYGSYKVKKPKNHIMYILILMTPVLLTRITKYSFHYDFFLQQHGYCVHANSRLEAWDEELETCLYSVRNR